MKSSGFHFLLVLFLTLGASVGCAVGPNYKRPAVDVPVTYRAPASDAAASPTAAPNQPNATAFLGDEKWWEVFQDAELQTLIRTAIKSNYDVRIAATRVLQARAQLGITRADQFPTLDGGGNITSIQEPKLRPIPSYELTQGEIGPSASWNLDFWGKYRRATEAARANLLANEWAQKAVIASLVAQVASSYFQLRELDLELEISQRTLNSRNQSLQLLKPWSSTGSTRCWMCGNPSNWFTPPLLRFLIFSVRLPNRKMPSVSFSGTIPAMCQAG